MRQLCSWNSFVNFWIQHQAAKQMFSIYWLFEGSYFLTAEQEKRRKMNFLQLLELFVLFAFTTVRANKNDNEEYSLQKSQTQRNPEPNERIKFNPKKVSFIQVCQTQWFLKFIFLKFVKRIKCILLIINSINI